MPTSSSSSNGEGAKSSVEAMPDIVSQTDPDPTDDLTQKDDISIETIDSVISSAPTDQGPSEEISSDQAGSSSKTEHVTPEVVAIPLPMVDDEGKDERWFKYKMSWSGKIYDIEVGANDLVYDFRKTISNFTNVPPERQKVVGLLHGSLKLSNELDAIRFGNLSLKEGVVKFTMIGTPEDQSFRDSLRETENTMDDFDVVYESSGDIKTKGKLHKDAVEAYKDPRNLRKVKEAIAAHPITIMNDPRPGKRLLVLDLDYTLVDTKPLLDGSLPATECARPHMHKFLEKCYEHYDIVIWSQTHWRWLESKLVELGIVGGEYNYKISFVLDRLPMFPVFTLRGNGEMQKHEVKPLQYIWTQFPQWGQHNTVHIDDLSRNFAMNPSEGLKVTAFKTAHSQQRAATNQEDGTLHFLGLYLVRISETFPDFKKLVHKDWLKGCNVAYDDARAKASKAPNMPRPKP